MTEPFPPHIVAETQELEAAAAEWVPLAAILWIVFLIALATSPAVVIAAYRVLL